MLWIALYLYAILAALAAVRALDFEWRPWQIAVYAVASPLALPVDMAVEVALLVRWWRKTKR
jgi:hypothetical protein